ncbi:phosphodiesterase [Methylobacterium terricola]|uniref:Phosphodiesterase n=1 Tax=Methylobacterium terricola TaxID=2583531 RepID=A0A5C4LGT1_9HYPH|nr:phosphodiesterase [Methylobacterium terricola]TNC12415.1 phosphodiesterase [Methylobacterium terricola]
MLIAQITDLHVRPRGLPAYRVSETNRMVARAVAHLVALDPRPDLVLVSGDLTDCGLPEEYEALRALLARLPMPVYVVPGNHDRRETFQEVLPAAWMPGATEGFIQYTVEDHPVRLIALDTLVAGQSHGALCSERLGFLERALAGGDGRPTLVFMHHPPFACGLVHMDEIRLLDGEAEFRRLIAGETCIERILCGHHHRPIQTRYAGTIAQIAPSVTHQVAFDLDPKHEGALVFEPPAYLLHRYTPESGIVSHMVYVEAFDGPYPFVLDAAYPGQH